MELDFLICGTPNDAFCSQIAFFRLCLDNLGGDYKRARLVATFGDHHIQEIPKKWQEAFKNIEVHWSHEVGEENIAHQAQHYQRFELIRDDADMAFICDADTAIMRPMPDLLDMNKRNPALYGVIAHYHFPFKITWEELANKAIGLSHIKTPYKYTLASDDYPYQSPFYINYGFLAGSPSLLKSFYERDLKIVERTRNIIGDYWAPQVSVALTCLDLNIATHSLPMKYNFPNDRIADQFYPEELDHVILMHYLRLNHFNRHLIFTSDEEYNKFLNLELTGSDKVFQQFVATITSKRYPFSDT